MVVYSSVCPTLIIIICLGFTDVTIISLILSRINRWRREGGENGRSPNNTTWLSASRIWFVSQCDLSSEARTHRGEMTSDLER